MAKPASASGGMVVHTRARALVEWLLPQTARFPREHRHTLTRHLCELAMSLHDHLIATRHLAPSRRGHALRDADIALDQLRQYLQLVWRWRWLNDGQFQHVSALTDELGRLIGGWLRASSAGSDVGAREKG